jgi:hypothetical protein
VWRLLARHNNVRTTGAEPGVNSCAFLLFGASQASNLLSSNCRQGRALPKCANNYSAWPWSITGTGFNATIGGGQTTSAVTAPGTGVGATLSLTVAGTRCVVTVGGTVAQPADADALYDNATGLLAATGTANLRVLATACPLLNAGDILTFSTIPASTAGIPITNGYTIAPRQLITSP